MPNKPEYTDFTAFVTTATTARKKQGKNNPEWIVAISAVLGVTAGGTVAAVLGVTIGTVLAGPIGALIGGAIGATAGRVSTQALLKLHKNSDLAKVRAETERLKKAKRIFEELQEYQESDPEAVRRELDRLSDDLVNDREIYG